MTIFQSLGVMAVLLVLYAVLLVGCEKKIIFHPSKFPEGFWEPGLMGVKVQDVYFKSEDGVKLHGWFVSSPKPRATLLWFHGNAGNVTHRLDNIWWLLPMNLNIFIFDYRGYGRSEGDPDEMGIYKDSLAAYDKVLEMEGVSVDSLFLFGRSLGGVCAVETALHKPARGLILESVFTSALDMSRKIFPLIPLGWAISSNFDAIGNIPKLTLPKLILHGNRDKVVPFDLGKKLYDAAADPKTFYTIEGAGHNNTYIMGGRDYFKALDGFITETLKIPMTSQKN